MAILLVLIIAQVGLAQEPEYVPGEVIVRYEAKAPEWNRPPGSPVDSLEDHLKEVLTVLRDPALTAEQRPEEVARVVLEFAHPDVPRRVLAREARKLSKDQQTEVFEECLKVFSLRYARRIASVLMSAEELALVFEREEKGGDVSIGTEIVGGKLRGFVVDFRLRRAEERWNATDLTIEGVSLVSGERSLILSVAREVRMPGEGRAEALLAALRTRFEELRSLGPLRPFEEEVFGDLPMVVGVAVVVASCVIGAVALVFAAFGRKRPSN